MKYKYKEIVEEFIRLFIFVDILKIIVIFLKDVKSKLSLRHLETESADILVINLRNK